MGVPQSRQQRLPYPPQEESDKIVHEILENEHYFDEKPETDKEIVEIINSETERAKQWRKPEFMNKVNDYVKAKYNKDINVSNRYAAKIYRKMYDEHMRNNSQYGLKEKILYHPDLTQIDQDFLNDMQFSNLRNIAIGQISVFIIIVYFSQKSSEHFRTNSAFKYIFLAPIFTVFPIIYLNKFLNNHKLRKLGFDRKYGLVNQEEQ